MRVFGQIMGGLTCALGMLFLVASFGPATIGEGFAYIGLAIGTLGAGIIILLLSHILLRLEEAATKKSAD